MSVLRNFFSEAFTAFQGIMGETFTYFRDGSDIASAGITVTGIVSNNEVLNEESDAVMVVKDAKAFRVKKSDLLVSGTQLYPSHRDYIMYKSVYYAVEGNDGYIEDAADHSFYITTVKRGG